ncbi:hypothetical protein GCM10009801_75560 [Streptomyces albiaxialis]|uniref:Uncharacterized protein n=1 Tax=Streptomyces albiaxialis TaxID=329523 RepID=A0ABN2WZU0_9ACTN
MAVIGAGLAALLLVLVLLAASTGGAPSALTGTSSTRPSSHARTDIRPGT